MKIALKEIDLIVQRLLSRLLFHAALVPRILNAPTALFTCHRQLGVDFA